MRGAAVRVAWAFVPALAAGAVPAGAPGEVEAIAFERGAAGLHRRVEATWRFVIGPAAPGFSLVLLDTAVHGSEGRAPAWTGWDRPEFPGSVAAVFDFGARAGTSAHVALHHDGTAVAVAGWPIECRTGDSVSARLEVIFVAGGGNVTLMLDGRYALRNLFVAGLLPFEGRVVLGGPSGGGRPGLSIEGLRVDWTERIGPPPEPWRTSVPVLRPAETPGRPVRAAVDFGGVAPDRTGRVVATLRLDAGPEGAGAEDLGGAVHLFADGGVRHELMRFAALPGPGRTRKADVTDLLPLLAGRRELELVMNQPDPGRPVSLDLEFFPGAPACRPFRVVGLWQAGPGAWDTPGPAEALLEPRRVEIPPETEAAKLSLTTEQAGSIVTVGGCTFVDERDARAVGGMVLPWEIDVGRCIGRGGTTEVRWALVEGGAAAGPSATRVGGRLVLYRLADEPERRYACNRAAAPPRVDGRIDEPAWDAADWTGPFVDIEGEERHRPHLLTRAKMLWDDERLYVAAMLREPHVWGSIALRDEVVWRDNDFEVFIDPGGDGRDYFEIEVNALGTVFDLMLDRPYLDGGAARAAWDARGMLHAVHVDGTLNDPRDLDRGWSLEIAIPWAALAGESGGGLRPLAGESLRVNFSRVQWEHEVDGGSYRARPGAVEDNWVWSPQGAVNMHLPRRWGVVELRDAPRAP